MAKQVEKTVTLENGQKVEIVVKQPTNAVLKGADRMKSKVWNESIQDGILTKRELGVLMRKRGIWDESKDKEETRITQDIVRLEKELYHGKEVKGKGKRKKPKVSEGRDIAVQIRRLRLELRDLIAERIGLEDNTAESIADNARFDYLVAHCTFHKSGQNVYKNFEDYDNRSADPVAFTAASALGEMLYNIDAGFEANLPENRFLTKFGLVNDNLELVDPSDSGSLIDVDGHKIDEDGYRLNDEGQRVDKEGNKLNDEGYYELTDYENDLEVVTKESESQETES
tara:strand:- start:827 stop:1678 length:852 start_codon:yes stop_codon:yes gene_type:complete